MLSSYSALTDYITPAICHVENCNLISLGFPSDPALSQLCSWTGFTSKFHLQKLHELYMLRFQTH